MSTDIGHFEGFNFRSQSAIADLLTADEVLNWDHDADGEAEFWPHGDNAYVQKLLPGSSCGVDDIRQVIRIFDELGEREDELAKVLFLKDHRGLSLKDIDRQAIDDACLYVFGPGYLVDLDKDAAYELFETFWPDAYTIWERSTVPGLHFDVEDFLEHFSRMEVKLGEGRAYLIIDTE